VKEPHSIIAAIQPGSGSRSRRHEVSRAWRHAPLGGARKNRLGDDDCQSEMSGVGVDAPRYISTCVDCICPNDTARPGAPRISGLTTPNSRQLLHALRDPSLYDGSSIEIPSSFDSGTGNASMVVAPPGSGARYSLADLWKRASR
jgi:hypothetical protein